MTSRNRRKRRTQRQPAPHQVGAETTPQTVRHEADGTTLAQTRAPGEPAVIERVSARGAEYTHVKMIVVAVPPPLGIMFWNLFGAKSYRTVDKNISDRARAARTREERDYAMALRWEFCLQVIRDLNNLPPTFKRRFQLLASQTGTRLVVYDISKRPPRVVEEQQIPHEIRTLGDKTVPWANLDVLSQATLALLWKYFPMRELLSWRPGRYWRTRRSPQGWPLIVRAIETLYDYLLAGNSHPRRELVDGAWAYRYPAKVSRHLQLRLEKLPAEVQAISWKAPLRLCKRYRQLPARGTHVNQVVVAIAREMAAFAWAIARLVPLAS